MPTRRRVATSHAIAPPETHALTPGTPDPRYARRQWAQFAAAMRDAGRRSIYFSVMAIPGHLAMAGWKGALLVVSPSLFMLANVLFTLGLALIKMLVVLADRRVQRDGNTCATRRAYQGSGAIVVLISVAYAVCCLPIALGTASTERYEHSVAIAIAAVAFTELGFSVHGFFFSRRRRDLLMEAVKLSTLAASLTLLVLTQTALLSISAKEDHSVYNGVFGIVMGAGATAIGVRMLIRRLPRGNASQPELATAFAVGHAASDTADAVRPPL